MPPLPLVFQEILITQATIQQIQNRIDIIDVVSNFVKLKKRGSNYLGLCPFHNEKTPSFTVSASKEIYKCFGCGKSGNTISFIMEHEKYNYVEALRWLANRYNVDVEETEVSPEVRLIQQASESLFIINEFARDFFADALFNTDEGRDIGLSYLKERGFREDIIKKFQLGFNPQARDEFTKAALQQQYNEELLVKTGLVVNRDGKSADNYRGRIIFPVHNQSGKVLGFGARVIKTNDRAPKYINTPENEVYVKSRILYGSYFARQAIDKENECLLVEGYTDVVSLHQAGIENVVASGGTSLTPDQLRLVKKYTQNLTILYDGDSAGVKAALRGLDLALEEGLNVKLALIPNGEDPDSYVNKLGAQAFRTFISENKKDFILFQLDVSLAEAGNDSVKKSALVNQMAETLSRMNRTDDFIRRQDYVKRISETLKIEEAGLNDLVNQFLRQKLSRRDNFQKQEKPATVIPQVDEEAGTSLLLQKDDLQEQAFVRSLLEFGLREWDENEKVADYLFREMEENDLENMMDNAALLNVVALYKKWYFEGLQPTDKTFLYHEDQELNNLVIRIMEVNVEISPKWSEHYEGKILTRDDLYRTEVASTLLYLKLKKIKRLIDENQRELEKATDPQEILLILQTHQHLKETEMHLTQSVGTVILK